MSDTSTSLRKWDVFLSFKGLDTRHKFISFLYQELVRRGVKTFKDDKVLECGQRISPELKHAIEVSKFAVVVVSVNYAASSWCLDELVNIMELENNNLITVLPIFYGVAPSQLRWQNGEFAEQFKKHESRKEYRDKVASWKQALTKLASISGYCSWESQDDADLVDKIADRISEKLMVVPKGSNGSNLVDQKRRSKEKIKSWKASATKWANDLSNHDKLESLHHFESESLSFSSTCSFTPRQFDIFVSLRGADTHHQFSLHGVRSKWDSKIHGSYSTQS